MSCRDSPWIMKSLSLYLEEVSTKLLFFSGLLRGNKICLRRVLSPPKAASSNHWSMWRQKLNCGGGIEAHTCLYNQNLSQARTSSSPLPEFISILCSPTEQPLIHVLPSNLHPRTGNVASDLHIWTICRSKISQASVNSLFPWVGTNIHFRAKYELNL